MSKFGWVRGLCQHYPENYEKRLPAPIKRGNRLDSSPKALIDCFPQMWCRRGDLKASSNPLVLQRPMGLYPCSGQIKWPLEGYLEASHQENYHCGGQNRSKLSILGPKDEYLLSLGISILLQGGQTYPEEGF